MHEMQFNVWIFNVHLQYIVFPSSNKQNKTLRQIEHSAAPRVLLALDHGGCDET